MTPQTENITITVSFIYFSDPSKMAKLINFNIEKYFVKNKILKFLTLLRSQS